VLIEDAGSGTHLVQELNRECKLRPIPVRPEGDKIVRMEAQSALIEAGHVFVPESAPWLADFQSEIMAFPYGRHDDQVDTVSQFLMWQSKRQSFIWTDEHHANFVKTNERLRGLPRTTPFSYV
jgi:predicted phage terminase large subunit-like protein